MYSIERVLDLEKWHTAVESKSSSDEYNLNTTVTNNIDNMIKFEFEMINREEERSQQTHGQDLYLGGTLTVNEYRKEYLNSLFRLAAVASEFYCLN